MITLRNLTSPAGTESKTDLDSIDAIIEEGEVVSLGGLSSTGRRRILAVLGLYSDDWSGEYELMGTKVHKLDDEKRTHLRGELVGAFMRGAPLVDCLTVEENLEIPLSYRNVLGAERDEMITDALSSLGISAIRHHEVDTLPPDQSQLVGIAKALVSKPKLVLFEEPSRDLNPLQLRLLGRELARVAKSGCVVIQSLEQIDAGVAIDRVLMLGSEATVDESKSRARRTREAGNRMMALR